MRLATDVVSIKVTCDYNEFIMLYKDSKLTNNSESTIKLIESMNYQFDLWDQIYTSKSFSKDITLYTLFSLIKADDKPKGPIAWKLKSIDNYIKYTKISFKDLCLEAFLKHLKKETKVSKNYNHSIKFFFYLSKEIKMFLFKKLRNILQETRRDYYTNSSFFRLKKYYNDSYVDINLLEYIQENNMLLYSAYLLYLSNTKIKADTLRKTYNLSKTQANKLEEDLCLLIKTLPLSS